MSKRRSIHRKSDSKKTSHTNNLDLPQLASDPISFDIPSRIKFLRSFERVLEPTLYTKPISIAYFCFSVTLLLSLFSTYFPFIREFAIPKTNFLNVYFVKNGWSWTLLVVGLYLLYSSAVYTLMDLKLIAKHFGRLIVSTAIWYSFTNVFDIIEEATGYCTNGDLNKPRICKSEGFEWVGYDVSGHCFILTFSMLVIVEEYKTSKFVYWDSLASSFVNKNNNNNNNNNKNNNKNNNNNNNNNNNLSTLLYEQSFVVVLLLKLAALVLLFIWQWMLITSALFYHRFSENLIGTVCGIVAWWSTYVLCFHPQKYLTYPGDGHLGGHFKEFSDLR